MQKRMLDLFGKMLEQAVKNPESTPDKLGIILLTEDDKQRLLTPERLKLLRTIREKNPQSVKELAKLTDRRIDAVSRDLRVLRFYGFLDFVRIGKKKIPKVEKEFVLIPLKV